MRRPIELTWLKVQDVIGWRQGMLWIRIPKSKTDQFGKGKLIPIDAVPEFKYCPAGIIWKYYSERKQGAFGGDFLFLSCAVKPLSSGTVSTNVKKVAKNAKLEG